jgi:omega-amidase
MKIGLCQFDIKLQDREENKKRILKLLGENPLNEVDWLIFPELTLDGSPIKKEVTELTEDDFLFFETIAKKHNIHLTFGCISKKQNKLFTLNTKGETICDYSKVNLFQMTHEDKFYIPGANQDIFEIDNFKILPSVCFDLKFPKLYWDKAEKADIIVNIANWPKKRNDHWTALLKARAIENQTYMIGVNRTGVDGRIVYGGNSVIYDPIGMEIINGGYENGIYITDINLDEVKKTRIKNPIIREN